jgi:NAD(P)-dependent dehydrogenase (short-subunit alcohol dehydrogenase family)
VGKERVIVTGGASGIGAATVDLFRDRGADVTVLDLPAAKVPDDVRLVECDLGDPSSIGVVAGELGGDWDALCNVAGVPGTHDPARILAVNFLGPRLLTELLLDRMAPGGAVVNVASTAGCLWQHNLETVMELVKTSTFEEGAAWYAAQPVGYPPYNLSKEAVIYHSMQMSVRAWRSGVRINSVSPGPVETPVLPDFEESMGKGMLDWVKGIVSRHAKPEEIAPVITFLASPASSWVNGANVIVDGGFFSAMLTGSTSA